MKNIYLILGVFTMLFSACETDFDVNAEWEETTVVFGLLDASDENQLQKIKISKAFLGNMDAYQMAQYSDSINYGVDELDVKIYKWDFNQIEDSVELIAVPTYRDGEIFYDSIIVYQFDNVNLFLQKGYEYELVVKNNKSGNVVQSTSKVVGEFSFGGMDDELKFYKPFNPDSTKFTFEKITWDNAKNAAIYQLTVRINYTEGGETLHLDWIHPIEDKENLTLLLGRKFFSFLVANSQPGKQLEVTNSSLVRRFQSIDLFLTAGTADLDTYIKVNEPITGIVQERPQYSNINNGIGLFSSRYSLVKKDELELSDGTKDYVRDNLNLNFQ